MKDSAAGADYGRQPAMLFWVKLEGLRVLDSPGSGINTISQAVQRVYDVVVGVNVLVLWFWVWVVVIVKE